MPDNGQKRWIVVLDKVPRGPLTTEEVQALLDQGHLRYNDMGFEIPAASEAGEGLKEASAWKLLWQFPDFDRRDPDGEPPSTRDRDKRYQPPDPAPVSALPALPPEALNIPPEDLVLSHREPAEPLYDGGDTRVPVQPLGERSRRFLTLSVGLVLAGVVLFAWLGSSPTPRPQPLGAVSQSPDSRPRALPTRRPTSQRRQALPQRRSPRETAAGEAPSRPIRQPAPPPAPAPAPRERSAVNDEEIRYGEEGEYFGEEGEAEESFREDEREPGERIRRPARRGNRPGGRARPARRQPDAFREEYEGSEEEEWEEGYSDTPPQDLLEDEGWEEYEEAY